MNVDEIPEEGKRRTVRVQTKVQDGSTYEVVGLLTDITDEGLEVSVRSRRQRPGVTKRFVCFYRWDSIEDVQLQKGV